MNMSASLSVKKSDWLTDWYVLVDEFGRDSFGASVEGGLEDWLEIAQAMQRGESCRKKRCAAVKRETHYEFFSPRNSLETEDTLMLEEVPAFIETILALANTVELPPSPC